MNYQPPVIGSKQLLNFTAYSYPDTGGVIIIGSALLALLFVFVELKKDRIAKIAVQAKPRRNFFSAILHKSAAMMLIALFLVSCSIEPQPIQYGKEDCAYCKMTIADPRFGCEFVTKKGKAFKFDSNECMVNYISKRNIEEASISLLLSSDFSSPGNFINANNAFFVMSDSIQSPMGAGIAAFSDKKSSERYDGKNLKWTDLFQEVSSKN